MLKGFKVHGPQTAVAIDRDHLQPHFDINRFGKDTPVRDRLEQAWDHSTIAHDKQRGAEWLLSIVSDMLLSRDASSCLRAAGDGMRQAWEASYVIVASSFEGIDIDEVMPVGIPAVVEWIDLRDSIHAALLETILTGRVHQGVVSTTQADRSPTCCGYAVQQLASQLHGCASFAALPLFTSDGHCKGALFVAWSRADEVNSHRGWLDDPSLLNPVADVLQAKIQPKRKLTELASHYLRQRIPVRRPLWLALLLVGVIAVAMFPTAYPVRAKVFVVPDQVRWISAPFDAR